MVQCTVHPSPTQSRKKGPTSAGPIKGELVALWSQAGNNTAVKNDAGTVVHRFYWGLKTAVWNNDGDCAVLLHVPRFQAFKARG